MKQPLVIISVVLVVQSFPLFCFYCFTLQFYFVNAEKIIILRILRILE